MAQQGASLQNYNNQLVSCLEELKESKATLDSQISGMEQEKYSIEKQLGVLTEKLSKVNERLNKKVEARSEYDRAIQETESAYLKILESSQTLLHVLKRESTTLSKKTSENK